MSEVLNKRNSSIDIFRIICALGVVAIHAHPFKEFSGDFYFIFVEIFSRIAVPFFFTTIGYYFIKRLESCKKIKPYILNLFRIYVIWSLIYAVINFVISLINERTIPDIISDTFKGFLILGISEHLWFFPALFIALFVLWVFYKLRIKILLIPFGLLVLVSGVLITSYSNLLSDNFIFRLLINVDYVYIRFLFVALPYLVLGYVLHKMDKIRVNNVILSCLLVVAVGIYVFEKYLIRAFGFGRASVNCFSLYVVLLLILKLLVQNPLPELSRFAKPSRDVANFTYYAHPIFLETIRFISGAVVDSGRTQTFDYVLTCIITLGVGFILYRKNSPKINKIFK